MIRPQPINGVITWPDGREECQLNTAAGKAEYERRTAQRADDQQGLCAMCLEWMASAFLDHQDGRGSGGSRRDDRIEKDGQWYNAALCWKCNSLKGSIRYHWIFDGSKRVYVPEAQQ